MKKRTKMLLTGLLAVVLIGGLVYIFLFVRGGGSFAGLFSPRSREVVERKAAPFPSFPDIADQPLDSDGDGLSDEAEGELGTDPYKVDTDKDGLFDREEIKVYQTDPLNPDSDGDGSLDGEEVRKGDNPRGEGMLLDFRAAVEKMEKE